MKTLPKKVIPKPADNLAERIVALALQHPDYGARRLLPLLEADGIPASASTVYRVLKHHGLQNRSLLLRKLKAQPAVVESSLPAVPAPLPPQETTVLFGELAEKMRLPAEEPQALMPVRADNVALARIVPAPKAPPKSRMQGAGVLTLFNVVLIVLLAYLGYYTIQNLRRAGAEPPAAVAVAALAIDVVDVPEPAERPIGDYQLIWKRNLFNVSNEDDQSSQKEIAVEKIALAEKDLGLRLVGTVAADDARLRRAFIDNSRTREQEAYREGDTAGEVRIKKILRNRVVVATREGDRLLSVEIEGTGNRAAASPRPQQADVSTPVAPAAAQSREPEVGVIEASLKRAQVASGLSENDYLMKQVRIFPYTGSQGEQLEGFRISNIRAGNVLLQMGLRSGDVITSVNGEAVGSPDDAAEFFERLTEGGELTIDINRRQNPLKLRLNIV